MDYKGIKEYLKQDLEMLREVGDGVAMKNTIPAVLEVANHVTDTNDDEGVLNYIEKNIL